MTVDPRALRASATFPQEVIAEIQRAADQGVYEIRGFGGKRRLPSFDDLVLLGASVSRYPLEGYRERCETSVTLGARHAKRPIELKIPITIAGMSFGALGANAKEAIGQAATAMGTSTGQSSPERRSVRSSPWSRRWASMSTRRRVAGSESASRRRCSRRSLRPGRRCMMAR